MYMEKEIDKLKKIHSGYIFKINVMNFVKDEIIEGITIIINLSVLGSTALDLLKIVNIVTVYRNGHTFSPNSYRSI